MNANLFEDCIAAPAKINLALHVVGRQQDGYHLLESVAVFTERVADWLSVQPAVEDRLIVEGPFAAGVPTDHRNIVLRALVFTRGHARKAGVDVPPLLIRLTKMLPHGAGIGGGSADAAALLRHLGTLSPTLPETLAESAAELGADVPMCLHSRPLVARGIGEALEEISIKQMPAMLLVNPGRPVATPSVFGALQNRENAPLPTIPDNGFSSASDLLGWLRNTRNDLEETAKAIEPSIGEALAGLQRTGAAFARMSGSGSTVFGLYDNAHEAQDAAAAIVRDQPNWWVAVA
ncbi:isopentenyl monophosphate kinase [Fulvimarina pelagi HTCC2506]|uniref:4-diphosphocytidyl-2-C-methyl-D-erythritol kinase n=1 Tax=Fulvimarina pelagi HTCC2506 TaxID=314231 RepID=Q0G578_9HYPH|nr:4-(cytidine 5'-diphospho)-2-C-methyl-D-erythritol kinase [Fulvimarina pelagi]EAU43186.1 isopentenyl monophosphate kinase [Fulvimarina pelagi HTCC2506]